jgi:DNA-directed RNA polymerase specialized sigma24 family protein
MDEPADNREGPREIDWAALYQRLLACAARWFKGRGCRGVDTALPGTAVSARDLASKAVLDLLKGAERHPKLLDGDPFPYALRAMRNDFLDLLKREEFKRASASASIDDAAVTSENLANSGNGLETAEARSLVRSLDRFLGNDAMLKAYLEVRVVRGVDNRADIAHLLGVSAREVTDIQRRLIYKAKLLERVFAHMRPGGRKKV